MLRATSFYGAECFFFFSSFLTSVIRSQMFVCSPCCHQFKNQRLIQRTTASRFTAFLWLVLLFPLVFGGTRDWNEHLSSFFFFHSTIGRRWIPWEPLFCWRQRGHLLFTRRLCTICLTVSVRRQSPAAVSDAYGNFITCSSGLQWRLYLSVHTVSDCCLLLFVSEAARAQSRGGTDVLYFLRHMCNCSSDAAIIACRYMMGCFFAKWGEKSFVLFTNNPAQRNALEARMFLAFGLCRGYERESTVDITPIMWVAGLAFRN